MPMPSFVSFSSLLPAMSRITSCACIAGWLLFGAACAQEPQQNDSLVRAEQALERAEIADAEMYFERYLRKHPEGSRRWYVWQRLKTIALQYRQEKKTARSYLEVMYLEFADDAEKKRAIAMELASLATALHDDARAIALWEQLLEDTGLPVAKKAQVQRELSAAYLRRLDFNLATETLQNCVNSTISDDQKAECLYDLAVTQTLTEALPDAESSLRSLLAMDGLGAEKQVLAIYTLADVLEQQEKYAEAFTLFERIRTSYPNEKVIELRLGNLRPKVKK